ncbi:MAG: hypothetical protein JXA66_04455 [Oligoflexia bacterium]|nr:hypothetical protein [Oligoflexia bacterium]
MSKGCVIETIINAIDEIDAGNCNICSVCREGRKWVKNLITRKVSDTSEYSRYFNILIEMGYYIMHLSDCEKGKALGKLLVDELNNKSQEYYYHLETGQCRRQPL